MRTPRTSKNPVSQVYVIGGGIAGLAAAALLVRDGGVAGERIHVLEQSKQMGGSLDGAGDPQAGYVIRGGRMFEAHFACTFDLFATIPSLADPATSVTEEIRAFTRRVVTSSKSRLVVGRQKVEAPPFGLSLRDKWDLARLTLRPESSIGPATIEAYFAPEFFTTNFWLMWCTMFAFQPWHSLIEFRRYARRFIHLLPGLNRLEGIHRTPLNQYDSLVLPLCRWLERQGVRLRTGAAVADIEFAGGSEPTSVARIVLDGPDGARRIDVGQDDLVLVTLGSMTEDSALGAMQAPVRSSTDSSRGAWQLWRNIARRSPRFGRPDVFAGDVSKSSWESFTVTLEDPTFFSFMELFTGNRAGTGGLVTLTDSNWLLSVVLAHQPHFLHQPPEVQVFWGYGLHPERPGNRVGKPMAACSGAEILEELFFHLPLGDAAERVVATANCIPCALPFITSQFMPRSIGDRPAVIPPGARNFAFLGQFCEAPEDTVFTVEYSVRTAQMAVYGLLGLDRKVTPIYRGYLNPGVLLRALQTMM